MELIIEERTGDKRTIVLRGRSMANKDDAPTFGVSQRGRINYPPGAPVADATLLGAVWDPTTFAGEWDDKYFDNPNAPFLRGFSKLGTRVGGAVVAAGDKARNCLEIVEAMTSLARGQQLLRVELGPKVMFGILWKFEPAMLLPEKWRWSAEFHWTGDTEMRPVVKTPKRVSPRGLLALLQALLEAVRNAISVLNTPAAFYQSRLKAPMDALTLAIAACIEELTKIVTNAITPQRVLGDMRANLIRIKLAALDLAEACRRLAPFGGDALRGRDKPVAEYGIILISQQALKMAAEMAEREYQLGKLDTPDVLDIVTTGSRESLRDISQRYYGTPGDWIILAAYNNLPCNPPAGTDVIIPTKAA